MEQAAPADVIRTRIMSSTASGGSGGGGGGKAAASAANGIASALSAVLKEPTGARGLLRGWLPAYLRIGPLFLGMPVLIEQSRARLFGLGFIE